jgi:hypothetical protein
MDKKLIFYLLGFCILFWTNSRAQGSGLLIQQYGKSNVDEIGLRKWNFDAHLLSVIILKKVMAFELESTYTASTTPTI